jgi:diketogulonate reductase-like aldo/keto reductase
VSNFDEEELAAALRLAGPGKIACNQVLYHLEERAIEHAVIPFCDEQGIAVVAYSPFGRDCKDTRKSQSFRRGGPMWPPWAGGCLSPSRAAT